MKNKKEFQKKETMKEIYINTYMIKIQIRRQTQKVKQVGVIGIIQLIWIKKILIDGEKEKEKMKNGIQN